MGKWNKKPVTLTALIMASLLIVTSCASATESLTENLTEEVIERAIESEADGDQDVEIDLDFSGENEEGSFQLDVTDENGDEGSLSLGGGEIPEDLIVPVPDGGTVIMSSTEDSSEATYIYFINAYEEGRYQELVDFYEAWLDDNGYEYSSMNLDHDEFKMMNYGTTGDGTESVHISINVYTETADDGGLQAGVMINTVEEK